MKFSYYPSCMVPYTGLKQEVMVDELLEYGVFSIARRVDKAFSDIDLKQMSDGTFIIRSDSSLREDTLVRIPNLSTTMLRNAHSLDSAMLDVKMRSPEDDWKGSIVNAWKYKGRVISPNSSYLIVYKANLIHNQPVNYQKKFESRSEAEKVQENYENLKDDIVTNKFTKGTFYKSIGQLRLKHSPTMLNYWHFELKLVNKEGTTIENSKIKPEMDKKKMNMKESFVEYVWENYICKHFWVNKNPCETDIEMSLFEDDSICSVKRWAAAHWTKCIFKVFPIVADSRD